MTGAAVWGWGRMQTHKTRYLVSDAGTRHLLDFHMLLANPLEGVHLGVRVVFGGHRRGACTCIMRMCAGPSGGGVGCR